LPRQSGLHAAGVVISNQPLKEILPIQESSDGILTTQYSMEYLEHLGLIKMDILGLSNLTTISQVIDLINKNHNVDLQLSSIDLNDKAVFNSLSKGNTIGIFQLESPGMTNLITKIQPISIEDISIASALFRPGPQKNIQTYLNNKANPKLIKYLNKDFEQILSSTYNVIIYQEQVIQIVKQVANYSLSKADLFRRAISKKNINEMENMKNDFIDSAIKNHYSRENAETIYEYIFEFANYGFNHSHSLAYSYISYYMMYLKTYYPLEYFTVLLSTNDNSSDKISTYIKHAKQIGLEVLPPSINNSNSNFSIYKNKILFGFNAIKSIGTESIKKILHTRELQPNKVFTSYMNAIHQMSMNDITFKILETLVKVGCFDELLEDKTRI
jgi:DNA polymerase-3 subunit alpha